MIRSISIPLLVALLTLTPATVSRAADKPAAAAFNMVRSQFDELHDQYLKLVKQYQTAPPEQRTAIRDAIVAVHGQGQKLAPRLREVTRAAYVESPNADNAVTRMMLEVVAGDLSNDRYAQAGDLIQLLLKNKCPEQAVHNFAGIAAYATDQFDEAERQLKLAEDAGVLDRRGAECLEGIDEAKAPWQIESRLRAAEAKADDLPRVKFATSKGDIVLELYENEAPQTVGNFVNLVERGFYDGLTFHRVLPGFMAQGGDPAGDGTGGPGYEIFCECYKPGYRRHFSGTLSMAHAGRNTGGSQFFLTFRPTPHLDGRHTAFGRVVEGQDVLAKLTRTEPASGAPVDRIVKATVLRKRDHVYQPTKVLP